MSSNLNQQQFSSSLAQGHAHQDGQVTLYHRTRTPENAEAIRRHGFKGSTNSVERGDVYFSSHLDKDSSSYGEHVVPVTIPADHPYLAHVDTREHPDGTEEHWYSLPEHKIERDWIK